MTRKPGVAGRQARAASGARVEGRTTVSTPSTGRSSRRAGWRRPSSRHRDRGARVTLGSSGPGGPREASSIRLLGAIVMLRVRGGEGGSEILSEKTDYHRGNRFEVRKYRYLVRKIFSVRKGFFVRNQIFQVKNYSP